MTTPRQSFLLLINRLTYSLFIFLILSLPFAGKAQQTNNWYFGSAAGFANTGIRINFNGPGSSPVVSTCNPMLTEEGSSSISDASGNALFYSDGVSIWDASTNTTFGTGLNGGTSSTQSAIILPKPGATNQWLLFTSGTQGVPGVNYYTVSGTPGSFTISGSTTLVASGIPGEGLCVIGNSTVPNSYWVISRDDKDGVTGQVRAFAISAAGVVSTTAVTSILSGPSFTNTTYTSEIGTIKANTCQNKLAFTYLNGDVDLVNFNPSTGMVVANTARRINVASAGGNSGSYGIEFSPNDLYLYITNLAGKNVYRHNIAGNTTTLLGSTTGAIEAAQLQTAPDGNIYVAQMNGSTTPSYLGVITNPNLPGATFTPNSLLLSGVTCSGNAGFSYRGLPTFPKSLIVSSLNVFPGDGSYCTGTSIPLSFTFSGAVDTTTLSWTATGGGQTFTPGGASSTSFTPSVSFSTAGAKTVTLTFNDKCGNPFTETMNFTISNPKTPVGTISCSAPYNLILDNPAVDPDEPNYIWYKGSVAAANIIGIGTPLTYSVGNTAAIPSTICLGVASSASSTGGSNSIASSLTMGGAANGVPYVSNNISVLSDILVLKSFDIKFWVCPSPSYTVTIKNSGGTTVYSQTNTISGCATNTIYTVVVNTTLAKGNNYTITIDNGGAQLYRGTWGGATNAGQITYGPETFSGTTSIANIQYDYKNFTVVTTCSSNPCYSPSCTLPVSLVDFYGLSSDQGAKLYWNTASEINNKYFSIEHSLDGSNFTAIGQVAGAGNSNRVVNYSFIDHNASQGINYYRLAQHDFDGSVTYSKIISVNQGVGSADFTVFPNPSTNNFTLHFNRDFNQASILVSDVLGRTMLTQSLTSGNGALTFGDEFPKGVYLIQLNDGASTVVKRIIKE